MTSQDGEQATSALPGQTSTDEHNASASNPWQFDEKQATDHTPPMSTGKKIALVATGLAVFGLLAWLLTAATAPPPIKATVTGTAWTDVDSSMTPTANVTTVNATATVAYQVTNTSDKTITVRCTVYNTYGSTRWPGSSTQAPQILAPHETLALSGTVGGVAKNTGKVGVECSQEPNPYGVKN